jgi:NADH-quinone oxidoreductase subunit E
MNDQEREVLTQFPKNRSSLLSILQKFQEMEKYISPELISEIGQYLDISDNEIYSVACFYPRFRLAVPGEHDISVCLCMSCRIKGGNDILAALEQELNIKAGQTTNDLKFSLDRVTLSSCSGSGPVVRVDQETHVNMTPEKVKEIISKYK